MTGADSHAAISGKVRVRSKVLEGRCSEKHIGVVVAVVVIVVVVVVVVVVALVVVALVVVALVVVVVVVIIRPIC